jgi:squalene synthase HpnC
MPYDFSDHLRRFGPDAHERTPSLEESDVYCRELAHSHYENFSVAVRLTPKYARQHLCNVYAFCRWSDDLADETGGGKNALDLLDWWEEQLSQCFQGEATHHPVFRSLGKTILEYKIPQEPFSNLLTAFRQDQVKTRYADMTELLCYCENSANPVGRIVLHLGRCVRPEFVKMSDEICTGLQLANFCQDVARDWENGRVYLPQDVLDQHGLNTSHFERRRCSPEFRLALKALVDDAESRLKSGMSLSRRVPKWPGREIELFARGGLGILKKIRQQKYDVWSSRPTLSKVDKVRIIVRVLLRNVSRTKR